MKRILLMLIALTILIGCAKQVPTLEDYLLLKFETFKTAVEVAATDMEVSITEIAMLDRMFVYDKAQVAGYVERGDTSEVVGKGVHISKAFLVNSDTILRHVATHEVCHFHLSNLKEDASELSAERCVFEYLGEERFMEAYTELYAQVDTPMLTIEQFKATLGVQ